MKRLKTMLISLVAVFAIGAVAAAGAQAGNQGTIDIDTSLAGPQSCDFIYDQVIPPGWYNTGNGYAVDIENVAPDPNGTCGLTVDGGGTLYKEPGGFASFDGTFTVEDIPIAGDCTYAGYIEGTWEWNDDETKKLFTLNENVDVELIAGSIFTCPGGLFGGSLTIDQIYVKSYYPASND